jgi:hypothetical protein
MTFHVYWLHSAELDGKIIVNDEQVRIWKEVAITYFKALSFIHTYQMKKTCSQDFNQAHPK